MRIEPDVKGRKPNHETICEIVGEHQCIRSKSARSLRPLESGADAFLNLLTCLYILTLVVHLLACLLARSLARSLARLLTGMRVDSAEIAVDL